MYALVSSLIFSMNCSAAFSAMAVMKASSLEEEEEVEEELIPFVVGAILQHLAVFLLQL